MVGKIQKHKENTSLRRTQNCGTRHVGSRGDTEKIPAMLKMQNWVS